MTNSMTNSMTTPIATVCGLAAITLFMIGSLVTVGPSTPSGQLATIPATSQANG